MPKLLIETKKFFSTYAQFSRDVLFPQNCIGCGLNDTLLCDACAQSVRSAPSQSSPLILSAFRYAGVIQDMFLAIKIRKEHRYIPLLADMLWQALCDHPDFLEYARRAEITYIPMHWMKLNMRGFNQSEMLATRIAKRFNHSPQILLRRGRLGLRQSSLNRERRSVNVQGAFLASPTVLGKDILLIDDIRTTGATLAAATQALFAAGAREVRCVTVAQD
jgi:ComF family protein